MLYPKQDFKMFEKIFKNFVYACKPSQRSIAFKLGKVVLIQSFNFFLTKIKSGFHRVFGYRCFMTVLKVLYSCVKVIFDFFFI